MPILTEIWIYPIKSLGGVSLSKAAVEGRGFRYDRRWMLVSQNGSVTDRSPAQFLTQRSHTVMALIELALTDTHLRVFHRHRPDDVLEVPLTTSSEEIVPVTVWNDTVLANPVSAAVDRWFSQVLGIPCRLVRMPETTQRMVDQKYAHPGDVVSFADGYPYLLIGQASLEELNRRSPIPMSMTRFRPNLVVAGSLPHEEDTWSRFRVGNQLFYGVKPCARCVLTTIDPETGKKGQEPLRTLAKYRQLTNKIYFGQNLLAAAEGFVQVGDLLEVVERQPAWMPFIE